MSIVWPSDRVCVLTDGVCLLVRQQLFHQAQLVIDFAQLRTAQDASQTTLLGNLQIAVLVLSPQLFVCVLQSAIESKCDHFGGLKEVRGQAVRHDGVRDAADLAPMRISVNLASGPLDALTTFHF